MTVCFVLIVCIFSASAFKPVHFERLQETGSCPNGHLSRAKLGGVKFTDVDFSGVVIKYQDLLDIIKNLRFIVPTLLSYVDLRYAVLDYLHYRYKDLADVPPPYHFYNNYSYKESRC